MINVSPVFTPISGSVAATCFTRLTSWPANCVCLLFSVEQVYFFLLITASMRKVRANQNSKIAGQKTTTKSWNSLKTLCTAEGNWVIKQSLQFACTVLFLNHWAGNLKQAWLTFRVIVGREQLNMSLQFRRTVSRSISTVSMLLNSS